jgi:hypothetical protein
LEVKVDGDSISVDPAVKNRADRGIAPPDPTAGIRATARALKCTPADTRCGRVVSAVLYCTAGPRTVVGRRNCRITVQGVVEAGNYRGRRGVSHT